jgi:hypothetical protein
MAHKQLVSKFRGRCSACGLFFPAGTTVLWAHGAGAKHLTPAACEAAKAAVAAQPAPVAVALNLKAIADFLAAARDRGLKFPKARFLAPGSGELLLSLAGAKAKVPGSIQVVVRGTWIGRVEPDGTVVGRLANDTPVIDTLTTIAADPAAAAKAYGALTCSCSFCGRGLTDEGSIEVGYGPVCADKWGLPWKRGGAAALKTVPVAAA